MWLVHARLSAVTATLLSAAKRISSPLRGIPVCKILGILTETSYILELLSPLGELTFG